MPERVRMYSDLQTNNSKANYIEIRREVASLISRIGMIAKKNFALFLLLIILIVSSCQKQKAKVLIIGDSISIGYTPFVKEELESVADVFHNPGNAKHTGVGIDSIDTWISDTMDWDVIQFNWGLWDLCYRHPDAKVYGNRDKVNGDITFSVEKYASNLEFIIKKMKKASDAKLIFVTTSYVPENEAGRYMEDAIRYNQSAKSILKEYDILTNDIYNRSKEIHKTHGKGSDDVHYTDKGSELLGKEISKFLLREIN